MALQPTRNTLTPHHQHSYNGRPAYELDDECWVRKQLATSMDVECPTWMDWFHGGLQFQIEHHLLPRLPRHNLRYAKGLVKELCRYESRKTHTRRLLLLLLSHLQAHTHTTAPQQAQCVLPLARLLPSQCRDCAGSEEGSLRGMEGGLAAAVCSFPCVQLVLTTSPPRTPFMHRFDLFQQQVARVRSGAACCGKV